MSKSQKKAIVKAYFGGMPLVTIRRLFNTDLNEIIKVIHSYLTAPIYQLKGA